MRLLLGNSFPGLTDCTRMAGTWPDGYAGRGMKVVLLTRSALSTRESSQLRGAASPDCGEVAWSLDRATAAAGEPDVDGFERSRDRGLLA